MVRLPSPGTAVHGMISRRTPLARTTGPGVQKEDAFQLQLCELDTERGVFDDFRGVKSTTVANFKPPACKISGNVTVGSSKS